MYCFFLNGCIFLSRDVCVMCNGGDGAIGCACFCFFRSPYILLSFFVLLLPLDFCLISYDPFDFYVEFCF
jgi:hypothetical protein